MRPLVRSAALVCAVLATHLAVTGVIAAPAFADEPASAGDAASTPAPDETTGAEDEETLASPDEASVPPAAEGSADAPVVLEGPLRPKGSLPQLAAPKEGQDEWRRSFEGGVKWKKGDTSVTVSGAPFSSIRIGGSISR